MNLVVVGDCLRDVDVEGRSRRLCPDAPVPVVDVERERGRAGGAGLAATMAAADGVPVTLVTAIADDEDGELLRADLGDLDRVVGPARASTPVKTRVRCAGRSVVRLDRGGDGPPPEATDAMVRAVLAADAVLVSDYGRGLVADERLRRALREVATRAPVVWDPHPRGAAPVPGVWLATPNLAEATGFAGLGADEPDAALRAASTLRRRWHAHAVAVTTGSRGVVLDEGEGALPIPAPEVDVLDPCGAGDRFAAAAAAAMMAGSGAADAVRAAVRAAARFLAAGGVSASPAVGAAASSEVATTLEAAVGLAESVRARGGTVVATGGCFDLVHAGHARTLSAARALGDCLIVCLNSDASVRRLKGPRRPIVDELDRAELLRALGCVDAVVVFDEDDPRRVLARLRPDVWVKGGDYDPDQLPEADLVRGWGGRVVITPHLAGRSTTRLAGALAEAV